MANVTLHGTPFKTCGSLPAIGAAAPDFTLLGVDLKPIALRDLLGKRVVLNVFPSVDTGTCAASVRRFNEEAAKLENTVVMCVSFDLPFAQKRFCGGEGIESVVMASAFRHREFARVYGLELVDGPLAGLMSRAVIVIDPAGKVAYTEQVAEIGNEPAYDRAIASLSAAR